MRGPIPRIGLRIQVSESGSGIWAGLNGVSKPVQILFRALAPRSLAIAAGELPAVHPPGSGHPNHN